MITGDQDLIVIDGVFLGLNAELAEQVDILISICVDAEDESARLDIKWQRDGQPGSTHQGTHQPLDFAEKLFVETLDCQNRLTSEKADYVWARRQRTLYVR